MHYIGNRVPFRMHHTTTAGSDGGGGRGVRRGRGKGF